MATNAAVSPKGIAAALLGLVIVGGLASTPFYLRLLGSQQRQLEESVEGPIETIRRVVLSLDENLSALADLHASLGEEDKIEAAAIEAFLADEPDNLDKKLRMDELNKSTRLLRNAESNDQKRGTKIEDGQRVQSGRPNVRAAVAAMQNQYLTAHKKLMERAQKAINELRSASVGSLTAGNHLGANRIQAILHLNAGRIERNSAEFEYWQAGQIRRQAEALVEAAAELRREDKRLATQRPIGVLDVLQQRIGQTEEQITKTTGLIAQLSSFIHAQESRIAELESAAAEARGRLAALEASGQPIHGENSEFLKLSNAARKAEAEAQALQHGTLADAKLKLDESGDMLSAPYEGGQPRSGVADLQPRLEELKEQLTHLEKTKADLLEQKGYYSGVSADLDARAQSIAQSAEAQWSQIRERLAEAETHMTRAEQASAAALQAFNKAARFAKAAVAAAARKVREARSASAEAKGPEAERLKMIASDGDTEAAMQCLAAEIAYHIALARAKQMEALEAKHQTEQFVAAMLDREAPESIDSQLDELRTEAITVLADAEKAYESASRLIEKTRAKSDRRTIQGKDYVWQVQVGQAAVHLLRAALLVDAEEAYAQKAAAYDLLTAAAEGREQSPLLTPAIDTLVYLQQTTK